MFIPVYMGQVMKDILILASLLLPILLLGFGMYKAARWSRIKNERLRASHEDSQRAALSKILNGDITKNTIANYYASSVSNLEALVGKTLALAIILCFVGLAVLAAYFTWVRL